MFGLCTKPLFNWSGYSQFDCRRFLSSISVPLLGILNKDLGANSQMVFTGGLWRNLPGC